MPTSLPADLWGLLGLVILVGAQVIISRLQTRRLDSHMDKRLRKTVSPQLDRVHEHVVNTHTTNLRGDLDELASKLDDVRAAVGTVAVEVRKDRKRFRRFARRHDLIVAKHHPEDAT